MLPISNRQKKDFKYAACFRRAGEEAAAGDPYALTRYDAEVRPYVMESGGVITAGNASTYIESAAIGNAQIGGDIWSSNFAYGSAGWLIGSLYIVR